MDDTSRRNHFSNRPKLRLEEFRADSHSIGKTPVSSRGASKLSLPPPPCAERENAGAIKFVQRFAPADPFPQLSSHQHGRSSFFSRFKHRTRSWKKAFALFLFFMFVGCAGFLSQKLTNSKHKSDGEQSMARAEALRLIDQAVTARYDERYRDAMLALSAARRADPSTPGIDVLEASIAHHTGDMPALHRAVQEALLRNPDNPEAKTILAVETWRGRNMPGQTPHDAGAFALQLLQEAASTASSSSAVYFFWGELERLLGREESAWPRLVGAVYRQLPWESHTLIAAQLQKALAEAAKQGGAPAVPARYITPSIPGDALITMERARNDGLDLYYSIEDLRSSLTSSQFRFLLGELAAANDQNSAAGELIEALMLTRPSLPHENLLPAAAKLGSSAFRTAPRTPEKN